MQQGRLVKTGGARQIVDEYLTSNNAMLKSVVDLSNAKRHGDQGRRLKIEKLEWLSGLPMQHGEKFSIRIHFRTHDQVDAVSVGLGFSNLEGTRLLSYDTDFQENHRPDIAKGHACFTDITVGELPLAPGLYNFSIGCRSGDAFGLDYLPEAGQVEVIMGPKTPGYIAVPGAGVRLVSDWKWNFSPASPLPEL